MCHTLCKRTHTHTHTHTHTSFYSLTHTHIHTYKHKLLLWQTLPSLAHTHNLSHTGKRVLSACTRARSFSQLLTRVRACVCVRVCACVCVQVGLVIGFIVAGWPQAAIAQNWPTGEMQSRGQPISLLVSHTCTHTHTAKCLRTCNVRYNVLVCFVSPSACCSVKLAHTHTQPACEAHCAFTV